jgi:subtilisin family serine protease
MKSRRFSPAWAVLSAAVLMSACGGGEQIVTSAAPPPSQGLPATPNAGKLSAPIATHGNPALAALARGQQMFIVQMADAPAAGYKGGKGGFAATKPQAGSKLDASKPAVVNYVSHLAKRHDDVLAKVGAARKLYSYTYAFNGFAAELTEEQANKLANEPGVISVVRNELRQLDTATTPNFLGLSGPTGFWNRTGAKGENVVIGIIDGGITPEHPSFSDRTGSNGNNTKDGKLDYRQIPGWNGRCVPGDAFTASDCNQKLIGARYYLEGYGGADGVLAVLPYEFISPRDYDGHGTHTASTAGGNANVTISGASAVYKSISGIAPRARIAAYKACWGIGGTPNAGCQTVDTVAAIDQAVADGVDVINYSISGSRTNFRDSVEIAFLFAADAGVFVAASAGNSGPTTSTVAHPSPWITTVAAGTHTRDSVGSVTLGSGATFVGSSLTATGVTAHPFIDAATAGLPGADPVKVALCYAAVDNAGVAVLDPAKIAGKIVLCDRGVTARVNKSLAVKEAGGVGMVLANVTAGTLNPDVHSVPTVHVAHTVRPAIKAYAAITGASAQIGTSSLIENPALGPLTASFSSRGPLLAGGGDLLKPDIIAPGQDILAGLAPTGNNGDYFGLLSGTSMSSPHVAGIAALMKELHPTWSPMAIKSALMTSAGDVIDGGTPAPNTNPVLIFRQGAGHVQPNAAATPGLVFDSNFADWLGFLCGTQLPTSFCTDAAVPVIDASDMNLASIAIGDMTGAQTITRRVTNVTGAPATFNATHTGMAGFTVAVSPSSLTLAKGETRSFTVKFTRTAAAVNAYTGGQLTWTDAAVGTKVRVPMVVRPVALAAPVQVGGSYSVTFGYDGPFTATPRGLVAAVLQPGTVADDPGNGACSLTTPGATQVQVTVPAGTTYARFATFDAGVNAGADIDLCVFNAAGTQVGGSGSVTSAEEVNLSAPAAGVYTVVVQGYEVGAGSPFVLHSWLLGATSAGNMAVNAPATATTGGTGAIELAFSGLTAGTKYLGSIAYAGSAGMPAPTIVRIDQP